MESYILKLYVNSHSPSSVAAIAMIRSICQDYLYIHTKCDLEIIDIQKEPERVEADGIVAIPTLIRKLPLPEIRLIGALSFKSRVLSGLGISNEAEQNGMSVAQ